MRKAIWGIAALLVILSAPVMAASPSAGPSEATLRELKPVYDSILTIQATAEAGIITRAQADQGTAHYLKQAGRIAGAEMTVERLASLTYPESAAAAPPKLTALQRFAGFITFINVLWILGIGLGVVCVTFLFGSYVVELLKALKNVPLVVYEASFYGVGVGLTAYGATLSAAVGPYVGLTGCLLFAGALGFSAKQRKFAADKFNFAAILFVGWTAATLVYGSSMLGFIAVGALLAALGFSAMMMPLGVIIGFKDEASLGKATTAAFCLLALFGGLRVLDARLPFLQVFERGALFLGSFVGYLGLLIASSRWYDGKRHHYVLFQVVTIAAGIAAIALGSIFGIDELQKIGGTFFVLYALEKLIEIPAKSARGYAVVGLCAAAAIYGFCLYTKSHPETFRAYLMIGP